MNITITNTIYPEHLSLDDDLTEAELSKYASLCEESIRDYFGNDIEGIDLDTEIIDTVGTGSGVSVTVDDYDPETEDGTYFRGKNIDNLEMYLNDAVQQVYEEGYFWGAK